MSTHPKPEPSKPWIQPSIKTFDLSGEPYAEMIDILHAVHSQAKKDLSLHPTDRQAAELERSLWQQIQYLQAKGRSGAA